MFSQLGVNKDVICLDAMLVIWRRRRREKSISPLLGPRDGYLWTCPQDNAHVLPFASPGGAVDTPSDQRTRIEKVWALSEAKSSYCNVKIFQVICLLFRYLSIIFWVHIFIRTLLLTYHVKFSFVTKVGIMKYSRVFQWF